MWRERDLLLAAFQFLTRLPVAPAVYRPDWLPRSARYFPLVGIAVGCVGAATLLVAGTLWPSPLPQILAVAAAILLTGALHEDGLADCADSLGGHTREARLAIMKDSRLGSFGALALLLSVALQISALAALPLWSGAAALVGAHAGGRLAAVVLMAAYPYGGDPAAARVAPSEGGPRGREVALACLFGLAPLLLQPPARAGSAVLLGSAAAAFAARRLCRPLGGYTGDVIGATIASFQTAFLVGAAVALAQLRP
jgi:adenosylcobinamide-GDP ribazoletransferase